LYRRASLYAVVVFRSIGNCSNTYEHENKDTKSVHP
jgi:hypothetical protein